MRKNKKVVGAMEEITGKYSKLLGETTLFRGMGRVISEALVAMKADGSAYIKGEFLCRLGQPVERFGLVLTGKIQVCMDDIDGNRMIMANVTAGGTFGESLCFLHTTESPVYIVATEDAEILWLRPDDMFTAGDDKLSAELRSRFTAMIAERALSMNTRIQILSKLTIRDKLIALFSSYSAGAESFDVPFSREDMAAYIGADRSAMSRELSKMKAEGIIEYHKENFRILKKDC